MALSPPGARSSCAPPRTTPHPPPPTQACIIPARGRSRCVTVRCADSTAGLRVASRPQGRAGGSRGPGEAPAVCAQLTLFLPPLHMWFLTGLYKTSPGHPPGAALGWSGVDAGSTRPPSSGRPCSLGHVQPASSLGLAAEARVAFVCSGRRGPEPRNAAGREGAGRAKGRLGSLTPPEPPAHRAQPRCPQRCRPPVVSEDRAWGVGPPRAEVDTERPCGRWNETCLEGSVCQGRREAAQVQG